jgi:hypothetical protein
MNPIAENIERIRERIEAAARRSGRQAEEVRLVAATKAVDAARIREAVAAGVREIGENYVQEALPKLAELGDLAIVRHFIGHLQRNKAARAVAAFDCIQSIDSAALAAAVGRHALAQGRTMDVLVEVNLAASSPSPRRGGGWGERSGVSPEAAPELLEVVAGTPGLCLCGLMGIAPLEGDADTTRAAFRRLRALFDTLPNEQRHILSMGMSGDFEIAIEEGATMLRIGTGIFGQRRTHPR